jgi:hypothetical protein
MNHKLRGKMPDKSQRYVCKDCGKSFNERTGIKDMSEDMGIVPHNVDHGWMKSKNASFHFRNPEFNIKEIEFDKIDWEKIIPGIKPLSYETTEIKKGIFDRLVYTDTHIGMSIGKYAQYGGEWNEKRVTHQVLEMCLFVIKNRTSETLIIDDLGDFMDGWDAMTVRKGHSLPQNMDNREAFDVGIKIKLLILSELCQYYKKIIVHNVTDDNHSGAFGYIVNEATKHIAETRFPNVKVINYQKFMSHYTIGNNTFIICHGKDGINLKYGLKPKLDPKGLSKIDSYIDKNYLMKRGGRIEFSKGDSHVEVIDKEFPTKFEYRCYPAFSPSSEWVQANFEPKDYGFYFFNYYGTNRYDTKAYYFNTEDK